MIWNDLSKIGYRKTHGSHISPCKSLQKSQTHLPTLILCVDGTSFQYALFDSIYTAKNHIVEYS